MLVILGKTAYGIIYRSTKRQKRDKKVLKKKKKNAKSHKIMSINPKSQISTSRLPAKSLLSLA